MSALPERLETWKNPFEPEAVYLQPAGGVMAACVFGNVDVPAEAFAAELVRRWNADADLREALTAVKRAVLPLMAAGGYDTNTGLSRETTALAHRSANELRALLAKHGIPKENDR